MWLRNLFIAVAALLLIGLCRADVSEIAIPKDDLSVPFNDLLPPLLAESTEAAAAAAAATTTTTTGKPQTTTLITKPTKKSYYQQQQTQLSKEEKLKSVTNKQNIQLLSLDLLPPFEESAKPEEDTPQEAQSTTTTATTTTTTRRPITTRSSQQHVAKVQPVVVVARVQQPQPQISRFASVKPSLNPSNPSAPSAPSASSAIRQRLPSSPIFSAQFSNYFQSSTPRPRRGPLPTLTPFPHHIK